MSDEPRIDSETLFRTYASYVAAFLCRMGVRDGHLDDLVQEVFLVAHRKGGYRPGPASPTTFLARLAIDALRGRRRDQLRWSRAHHEGIAQRIVARAGETPEEALGSHRATVRMEAALAAMEPDVRAVFVLFELQGRPCQDIADGLGIKVGTVYSRLHAARALFRATVGGAAP